jgi:hypothetical protein
VNALRSDGQLVPSSVAALMLPSCSASWKARSASARSVRKRLGCQPSGQVSWWITWADRPEATNQAVEQWVRSSGRGSRVPPGAQRIIVFWDEPVFP